MLLRKAVILLSFALLAGAGLWLLPRSAQPEPETAGRRLALRRLLAPAGIGDNMAATRMATAVISHQPVMPVNIQMADIPAGVYDPSNQYDRWQRGEIDLEYEGRVSQPELAAMQAASLQLPPLSDAAETTALRSTSNLVAGVAFPALDINQCCGGGANVPPDPDLAVGPNHLIVVVNVAFAIYDKTGATLKEPTTFVSFFQSVVGCNFSLFDPNVLYDEAADRFIMAVDGNGANYCLAVSQSGNPLGGWNLYRFVANGSGKFFDFPHAGVGEQAIYMGGNMFDGSFDHSRIWAFPKAAMYNNEAATAVERSLAYSHSTPQPIKLHGYAQGTWPFSQSHYFLVETTTDYSGVTHTLLAWHDPFGANNLTTVSTIDLNTATGYKAGMPVDAPQFGGELITANDGRPLDFEYRNGYGWTTMTIACNPDTTSVNCVRWAQINLGNGQVVQAGIHRSSNQYRFFPDLAVNACNDMAVGYTQSSEETFPSVWVAGRQSDDAAGTLPAAIELKAGEIGYTAFDASPRRWGDYTGMTIDPDGERFWYVGQYSKITGNSNGRWGTYVGSFSFPTCVAPVLSHRIYLALVSQAPLPPSPPSTIPNGDFENGRTHWTQYAPAGWHLILEAADLNQAGYAPHGGNWAVWLGGADDDVSYIEQPVTVSSANPYLAYWYWIDSSDSCGNDTGWVLINNAVVQTHQLCHNTNSNGWTRNVINLSSYAGQSVILQIKVLTNSSANSNLLLDDILFQTAP
jgi:hypothetical protein